MKMGQNGPVFEWAIQKQDQFTGLNHFIAIKPTI
jgi:hypothetical protein